MSERTLKTAIDAVNRYCHATYPEATLVLLCGSWARDAAHDDSDLDVLVLDPGMTEILFEGVEFESWLIEVCALPPARLPDLFRASTRHRSAPVPHQVVDGIVVRGDEAVAREVEDAARQVLGDGPAPLSDAERLEVRWTLTALLRDLEHATVPEVPALAAQCHTATAKAVVDTAGGWRAERKALRRALVETEPGTAERLDDGLRRACQGAPAPLLTLGREILATLGGEQYTYTERYS